MPSGSPALAASPSQRAASVVVLRHADAAAVELAEQDHGAGVSPLGRVGASGSPRRRRPRVRGAVSSSAARAARNRVSSAVGRPRASPTAADSAAPSGLGSSSRAEHGARWRHRSRATAARQRPRPRAAISASARHGRRGRGSAGRSSMQRHGCNPGMTLVFLVRAPARTSAIDGAAGGTGRVERSAHGAGLVSSSRSTGSR